MTIKVDLVARQAVVLLCALAFASEARAQTPAPAEDHGFETRIFGHVLAADRAHACFARVYDAAHLARHPQQNVRVMRLLVSGRLDSGHASMALDFDTKFRAKGIDLQTSGSCGSVRDLARAGEGGSVAHCGVDCDGGSIDIALKEENSVLVTIPNGEALSYDDAGVTPKASLLRRRFAADDKVFRLDRAPLTDCLPLAADDDDKRAMRKGL